MRRRFFSWGLFFLLYCFPADGLEELVLPALTEEQARHIGERIWQNECGKKKRGSSFGIRMSPSLP